MAKKEGITLTKLQLETIEENIDDLEKLLTERISDLHQVKGGVQGRHAYCFYRQYVWNIKYALHPPKNYK